jgi:hypothetical protein
MTKQTKNQKATENKKSVNTKDSIQAYWDELMKLNAESERLEQVYKINPESLSIPFTK